MAVELSLCNNSLSFLVIILHVLVHFHTITSLFFLIDQIFVKRLQPIRQRITLIGFALDISSSAALSGTSLTHNSGTTFRSWFSIGLTSVVNAIPADENADHHFDHCSFAGVPLSGPRHTHHFPVATILLIGPFVLDVRNVLSVAILIKNKLVPVLHHLDY